MNKLTLCFLVSLLLLSSCAKVDYPVAHRHEISPDVTTLSYTADLRATHIIRKHDNYWICMEPAPDAAYAYDDEQDLSLSLISMGQKGKEGSAMGSEDLPMTGRVSYVLLARELNYRLCEMAINTNATFDQYFEAYQASLAIIKEVALAEAENITHTASVHVSTTEGASLNCSEAVSSAAPADASSSAETSEEDSGEGEDSDEGDDDN